MKKAVIFLICAVLSLSFLPAADAGWIADFLGEEDSPSTDDHFDYSPAAIDEPPDGLRPGEPIAPPEDEYGYVTTSL